MKVELKYSGLAPTFFENIPGGIVPKPGYGLFGGIDMGYLKF